MIDHYDFIDKNGEGYKERRLTAVTQLYNKLSADETNNFKDKINEVIDVVNVTSVPIQFLELRLKFKGNGNTGLDLEPGDIVHGFADETTIWNNAIYLGGDITDRANYQPIYEKNPLQVLDGGLILAAPQADFDLPEGATCQNVFVNESLYTNTTNVAFIARWVEVDGTVTIEPTPETNSRVVIQYTL